MSALRWRGALRLSTWLGLAVLIAGCVVGPGPGYDPVGVDYYEPYGGIYGGWGPGYLVGPVGRGYERDHREGAGRPRAYRPAGGSRSMPSLPSHGRSGGGRSR